MERLKMYDTRGILQSINPGGNMVATDVDGAASILTVAQIVGGVVVHTASAGANVTTDTAIHIIEGSGGEGALRDVGDTITCYYINDTGSAYDLTLVGGTDVTIADNGQLIGQNESAVLLFRKTADTTVTVYSIGGRA